MSRSTRFALGIALSPLIGVLIGGLIDDTGTGMAYGLLGGVVFGALLAASPSKTNKAGDRTSPSED